MILMRSEPFRDLDRLTQQAFGTLAGPAAMPVDAYQSEDSFIVHFDLPGVDPEAVEVDVERNVLTVRAERAAPEVAEADLLVAERRHGVFSRRLFLDESLDVDNITAAYESGVLTLRIPVVEQAKSRRIEISRPEQEGKKITT